MTYEEYVSFGKPVNAKRGEFRFEECPSCGDTSWHWYFNVKKGVGNCKKCDYSPSKKQLLRDLGINEYEERSMIDDIVDRLDELDTLASEYVDDEDDPGPDLTVPLLANAEPVYYHRAAVSYLLKRKVSYVEMLDYDLRFSRRGKYGGRIIFPIHDVEGSIVGFTARGIFSWSSKPKYIHPSFPIGSYLYGVHMVPPACENLVVVEGVFDQIRGGDGFVASFGKKMTEKQVRTVLNLNPKAVTIMYDSDALEEANNVAAFLSHYFPVRVISVPKGKDPGSMDRREIVHLINRTPLFRSIDWCAKALE